MLYAIWYDNSSGYFEPFKVVEASNPELAISSVTHEIFSTTLVATEASSDRNGFGYDPNYNKEKILKIFDIK